MLQSLFSKGRKIQTKSDIQPVQAVPRATAFAQGSNQLQIDGGTFNVVGGDSHTHIHYHGTTVDLESVFRAIPNFRKTHQDTLAKATPGTGMWLLNNDKFRVWLGPNGDITIFWGSGIPGAGKTIIAALVIDMLEALSRESGNQICVAFVYFRYSDKHVTVRDVLEILVNQTLERHPDCRSLVAAVYARHIRERTQPTEAELLDLLRRLSERMVDTFYVLDALDEAPVGIRLDLLKRISSLACVRLFITSRPLQALEAKFPNAHSFSIAAQDQDLDLHIAQKISTSESLQDLLHECDPSLQKQMAEMVKSKCGGMFLHASLQLDALQHCLTAHDVMLTLEGFPEKIEDVYQQTWHRIMDSDPRQGFQAQMAFIWVLNAKQPMTIDQLRHALATSPVTHRYDYTRLMPEVALLALCRGLIVVDEESTLVRLVRESFSSIPSLVRLKTIVEDYTAKRPLEDFLIESFPQPHSHLAMVCMKHLAYCGFQNTDIDSQSRLDTVLQADPLLSYAHNAWAFHAFHALGTESVVSEVVQFVGNCRAFPARSSLFNSIGTLGPLHLAAQEGLTHVLERLDGVHDPNEPTKRKQSTPLILACTFGLFPAVRTLLQCFSGIAVNQKDIAGMTGLMYAVMGGHKSIVKVLLGCPELDVNMVDNNGWSSLAWGAFLGWTESVELLLAHPDIKVNATDFLGSTALFRAAFEGHEGPLKLLLDRPEIQVNMADSHGTTPLLAACELGWTGVVTLLLAAPAIDVNSVDQDGDTPIKVAAERGHEAIVRLLLDAPGIDIGRTAMSAAMENEHGDVVRLLQDFGSKAGLPVGVQLRPESG